MKIFIICFVGVIIFFTTTAAQPKPNLIKPPEKSTVKIKVGVVMGSGDVKWIAKNKFYLLKKSMKVLALNHYNEVAEDLGEAGCDSKLIHLLRDLEELYTIPDAQAEVVSECQTSFTGDCSFPPVVPGNYYLTAIADVHVGLSVINWDLPVSLQSGETKYIELSNDNSSGIWGSVRMLNHCKKLMTSLNFLSTHDDL